MDVDGWHPDPYGIHEERLFAHGEPTPLVRDNGIGSFDSAPVADDPSRPGPTAAAFVSEPIGSAFTGTTPWATARPGRNSKSTEVRGRPTKPMLGLAALLIGAGVVAGILGIAGVGAGGNAVTTTTENPLVRIFLHLPPATTQLIPPHELQAAPPTTNLTSLEQALRALPRTTTPPVTPPPTATPPRESSPTPKAAASRVTQPPRQPAPVVASSIVATTTLPLTTLTTSVGDADQGWLVAYGSAFNTVQTDIEKLDRALGSSGPSLYANVHPYWQELHVDAGYALSLPPIPDTANESAWATALGDLSEGAAECIIGSAGAPGSAQFVPTIFNQGAAFITTGTTQLDGTLASVESLAAAASAPSRAAVRGWNQAHGTVFAALQSDLNKLNSAFSSAAASDYSTVAPSWQALLSDAQSALKLAPIPDALIQSYWATALNDLIQGSSDCLGSSEALPPSLFDQGVALIDSGTTWLSTSVGAVQSLG